MSQSIDVFRTMTDAEAQLFFGEMRDEVRPLFKQAERTAAETLRLRPVFLSRQPFPKRIGMIRKALSLKVNSDSAAELLAMFFMERYPDEVGQLLDLFDVEHEDGVLAENSPESPDPKKIETAVASFRDGDHPEMRALLTRAFAAQGAIDWPALDAVVFDLEEAK